MSGDAEDDNGGRRVNRIPPTTETKQRGHPMLWLFMGLFIFALFAGFALAIDWMDPQGSRLF